MRTEPPFNPHAIDREERSVDPAVVKEATGNLVALLNCHRCDESTKCSLDVRPRSQRGGDSAIANVVDFSGSDFICAS
jgi:hypothetical protein